MRASTSEVRDPWIGREIDGRYRIVRRLGQGGMGCVYLAKHLFTRREVAIKVLRAPLSVRHDVARRFRREAVAAASVGNPHIVDVLDMGRLEDDSYYLVMERLHGRSLAQAITEAGRLGMARAVGIAAQVCEALSAVHTAGIVHRDLKPENLFLVARPDASDFIKVLDFGVCKIRTADLSDGQQLTATGMVVGTPCFMAPEQISAVRSVDERADVYAIGAILFTMLTGRPPFEAPSLPALLLRVCNDSALALRILRPSVPAELEAVVLRALTKSPAERYPSAQALACDLLALRERARLADAAEEPLDKPALPLPALDSASPVTWSSTLTSAPARPDGLSPQHAHAVAPLERQRVSTRISALALTRTPLKARGQWRAMYVALTTATCLIAVTGVAMHAVVPDSTTLRTATESSVPLAEPTRVNEPESRSQTAESEAPPRENVHAGPVATLGQTRATRAVPSSSPKSVVVRPAHPTAFQPPPRAPEAVATKPDEEPVPSVAPELRPESAPAVEELSPTPGPHATPGLTEHTLKDVFLDP